METNNENTIAYREAKKRVHKLKGFYVHAFVYLVVNIGIIITNNRLEHNAWSDIENYYTALFWGIGLGVHGLSVFLPNIMLGKNWEEKKIQELMNKNK